MEAKTKKSLLVSTAVILIAGAAYMLYKKAKGTTTEAEESNPTGNNTDTSTSSSETISPPVASKPNNILAFQKFANSKGYSPKLSEDGKWGPKTLAAWNTLASDYSKSIGVVEPLSFKRGQKLSPRIPLRNSTAYDRTTGKALGRVTSATFQGYTNQPNKWFVGTVSLLKKGALAPVNTSVQLLTKDWQ
jgi:hypothetical protein